MMAMSLKMTDDRQSLYSVPNDWFPAFRNRFRKNRVRTGRSCRCCWEVCAAIARQAQEAGRRVSRAKEWTELQARTNGRYGKIELDHIWTDERQRLTYENGERYFLRKLWSSYGILTDERNSYVLCYGNGNGYRTLEIRHRSRRTTNWGRSVHAGRERARYLWNMVRTATNEVVNRF